MNHCSRSACIARTLVGRGVADCRAGGSPVHRVMRFDAILEWFGRYIAP